MDPVLQQSHDENEIRKLVIGFSLGMDSRDVDLFRASWAEEIELDLPPPAPDVLPFSGRHRTTTPGTSSGCCQSSAPRST
jgi:hypothetical protein